jgi:hypothetical protein
MSISILTKENFPEVTKVKKEFNIFRALKIKKGKLEMVEFFNKDGAFRGFGRDTKAAFKKATRVLKKHYR